MPDSGQIGKSIIAAAPVSAPNTTGRLLRRVLEFAIEGSEQLPGARIAAGHQLVRRGSAEDAIEGLIRNHAAMCGAQGFVTNLGGFVTLVVGAPTNLAGVALIQARMVAAIAHLRGYDIDSPRVRTAMILCLMGRDGVRKLMDDGILPSTPLAIATAPVFDATLDRLVSERVLGELLGRIGGRRAGLLFARRIPLLGGGVGGAMDGYSTIEIGGFARDVFITRRRITAG